MFFRKWLEQAEAVGSFPLTQSQCLAPGLILLGRGRVPMEVAASGAQLRGSQLPGYHRDPYRYGTTDPGQHWHLATGGREICMWVICISSAYRADLSSVTYVTSLHARVSHILWDQPPSSI